MDTPGKSRARESKRERTEWRARENTNKIKERMREFHIFSLFSFLSLSLHNIFSPFFLDYSIIFV